jgi:hypothetical protein
LSDKYYGAPLSVTLLNKIFEVILDAIITQAPSNLQRLRL